jgi:hypothetical protein
MNDNTHNDSNNTYYDHDDGPSLQIRIIFASAWILIAVAGILGKKVLILN